MKRILIVLLVLGFIGGSYGFYLFNKPTADVSNKKVDLEISAQDLIKAFKDDETVANSKFLNKVIVVSGVVKSVSSSNETQSIMITASDEMSFINCEMSQMAKHIKEGDNVMIKGQCVGYLLDVVLTKCIIQN